MKKTDSKGLAKKYLGKPMSHWEDAAHTLVVRALVQASLLDTRSIIGKLASERLMQLARAEDSDLVDEMLAEQERFQENMAKVLDACVGERDENP